MDYIHTFFTRCKNGILKVTNENKRRIIIYIFLLQKDNFFKNPYQKYHQKEPEVKYINSKEMSSF